AGSSQDCKLKCPGCRCRSFTKFDHEIGNLCEGQSFMMTGLALGFAWKKEFQVAFETGWVVARAVALNCGSVFQRQK
ncbi:hypothetical protein, partial [Blastomonas sp.]|uniref:hypothetical protein n=1 Tax=Blastomonas sp. TaxID=1909299 RepID=UPI0035933BD3